MKVMYFILAVAEVLLGSAYIAIGDTVLGVLWLANGVVNGVIAFRE